MRFLAVAVLAMGSLLASASTEAHSRPVSLTKHEALAVPVHADVTAFSGPGRPSISVHTTPSFHSAPAYHSFSPAPSRPFTFTARPTVTAAPTISTRPAATYPRPVPVAHYSVSAQPPVIHHYPPPLVNQHHSSTGGGGMSMSEALLLHQALSSSGNSSMLAPRYTSHRPSSAIDDVSSIVNACEPEDHFWRNLIFTVGGIAVLVGVVLYWRHWSIQSQIRQG